MDQQDLDYVKGHCGWDSVILVCGDQVPDGEEHRIAHTLLAPPCSGGVEVGFLYPSKKNDVDIRLRIIDSTTGTWLPMCGGMSQVIGLACMTTAMQDHFRIEKKYPSTRVNVLSDSGLVPIDITFEHGRIAMITTHLPDYVDYLYKDGVRPVNIGKIPAMKVGYFLVFKMADLIQAHPGMEFGHRRSGPALDLLGEIQMAYMKKENITAPTLYSMIYDHHPEKRAMQGYLPAFSRGKGFPSPLPWRSSAAPGLLRWQSPWRNKASFHSPGIVARLCLNGAASA